ncbi:hypothetical protein AB0M43_37680 [Longispora sp. NPDC051575]|uniref:hypothetical protein n=1 Tax=Longispora sp. NPDC051575 TaxID=3154943 RepID=UPI003429F711
MGANEALTDLGMFLKLQRTGQHLLQEDVARRGGCDRKTVMRAEEGKPLRLPSYEAIERGLGLDRGTIAEALRTGVMPQVAVNQSDEIDHPSGPFTGDVLVDNPDLRDRLNRLPEGSPIRRHLLRDLQQWWDAYLEEIRIDEHGE